ncbi:hypothetical protein Y1Q_0010515 [Alligator mississippiensis]|uniref:Uncharacterized protein n=1 Tax=Alligator mississippiensis TaxID=8496 RepID=A0A151ND98_ALLMI|nr:hypothetical protein Y1Q_0010515 [Alligator mississippiensis]
MVTSKTLKGPVGHEKQGSRLRKPEKASNEAGKVTRKRSHHTERQLPPAVRRELQVPAELHGLIVGYTYREK